VERARVLGVRVDCIDAERALERIESLVDAGGHHLVATVNPEFVMRAQHDGDFARVLESADLCLPDGAGVVWALRRQGHRLREQVAGTDLVPQIAALCARRGFRLFLLGAAEGVADQLAGLLRQANPGLQVASHSGSPSPASDAQTLSLIHQHRAQVLLVAYGAPSQELWIDRLAGRLGVSVSMGVGGAFDYLTGRARRAPRWMRGAGLEWLHRLAFQPWRIGRMAVLPVYAIRVLRAGS
jgi:N-acetylglucosaminyldiphosphoundecaprenol N-acetyl-beta-D-mannosaminyltransferase